MSFALALGILGCKRASAPPAEQTYADAWFRLQRGELDAAFREADQALPNFPDQTSKWHWKFTIVKAESLLRKRLNQQALDLIDSPLPPALESGEVAVWQKLTQGSAHCYLAQFPQAKESLDQAEALARQFHPELLGEVALRKGTLAFWQDDISGAGASYRVALQIARAQKDQFLETAALGSLALVATRQAHYDESIEWNREALQLSQSVGARSSAIYIEGNLGWSYLELGDYDNAVARFREAEDSSVKEGLIGSQLDWKTNIGAVDLYLRDYAAAERESLDALGLARRLGEKELIIECLNTLSDIALYQNRDDVADQYNGEALRLSRSSNDHLGELSSSIIQGRIESARRNREKAEQLLKGVIAGPAASASLRWEAEFRLATVYEDAGRLADAESEFRKSINAVESARASVQDEELRISFLTNAAELYDDYLEFLVAQNKTQEALRVAAQTRARTLVEGLGIDPAKESTQIAAVNWNQVARRENATILCYWLGSRHSYLWAIAPSGQFKLFTLPARDEIDAAVQSYAAALLGPRDVLDTANTSGENLYEMLIGPARNLIPRGSRVVIVPDGSLCGLNFETLLAPDPKPHYWIEDAVVTYADSLLLVAAARRSPAPLQGKLLLVGDPVSPSDEFPRLPQAAAEMSSVEKYFPASDTKVLSGSDATPQSYLESQPDQFSFIHFVAHGTSSRMKPLESAVILTKQGDSFKLYGRDVVKHPLKAELVTISACHGVGSRNYSAEGLVGLSWAFLRAGAGGVIAALWDVNDASTASLMDQLYGQMSKGKDPAVALRNAKLALLHSGTVYQKPFYWAAFQYYIGL